MDDRLREAIDAANARITFTNNKNNLKVSCKAELVYYYGGGAFEINPAFIGFLHALVTSGKQFAILLDQNDNPIRVEDLPTFTDEVITKYFEVTNEYFVQIQQLRAR